MKTFSSKLPWLAAMPTATSLAITCTATIVSASHWVGLTLPGMMLLPGSFSGMWISPRPQRGPEASQRTSLAIFIRFAASAFSAPWANTSSSLLVSAWNLFGAVTNSRPVSSDSARATSTSKPFGAFSPVPTAVPPSASRFSGTSAASSISMGVSIMPRQPLISWLKRMGVASWRWVRPDFTTSAFSASSRRSVSMKARISGSSASSMPSTAAMCMAVGKVSLLLWDMFTSSLGCSSLSPAMALPRLAMTSLAFMLDWVPLPVCHTTSGKWSFNAPAITSSQAALMASSFRASMRPGCTRWLAMAATFFKSPKACMISGGMRSPPILKFW